MAARAIGISLAIALMLVADRAHGQGAPIHTNNPTFQASLERIAKRSASWREAVGIIGATGRRAVVVTPDQVSITEGSADAGGERFDESLVAEAAPVVRDDSRVDVVIVIVNLAVLEQRQRERQLLPVEFDMDLDRILVHEIYGHAFPYLLAGHVSGRCADPGPRERAVDACSIRRENAVRAEMGLGRRVSYGLDDLNLSRRR